MKLLRYTIYSSLFLYICMGFVGYAHAATEFVSVVDPGGTGDYSSLNAWETGVETDLTAATTKVFAGTLTAGPMADNASVAGETSGATATLVHVTATQILVESIANGPFQNGEKIWLTADHSKYFTTSDTGDSAIAVAKCQTSNGATDTTAVTISGWTTNATNYIKIWTDPSEPYRHQGKWDDTKYNITSTNSLSEVINIQESYTKIDGLEIKNQSTAGGQYPISVDSSVDNISISNNIVRNTTSNASVAYGISISSAPNFIWNNIIYDFSATDYNGIYLQYASGTAYVYNNSIYNSYNGITRSNGTVVIKNNIVQNCTDNYVGTFDSSSTYNITDLSAEDGAFGAEADSGTTDGGDAYKLLQSGQNFTSTVKVGMIVKDSGTNYTYVTAVDSDTQLSLNDDIMGNPEAYTIYTNMYGNVTFEDEANDDFHLADSDTVARDKGANLYADGDLAITADIDGSSRPNSATLFDIGADEAAIQIYYSVGQNTNNNETGAGNVTVSANTREATFTVAQTATNMGVGDIIDYDADNKKCYITKKVSTYVWKCQSATGGAPTAATGVAVNSIHHAVDNLDYMVDAIQYYSYAESLLGTDFVTGNYVLNVPCYYDTGPDAIAQVEGYTTSVANYIKVYTPNNTSTEVNRSQRHNGTPNSGYRIVPSGTLSFHVYILDVQQTGTIIDGIEISENFSAWANYNISGITRSAGTASDVTAKNNLIHDFSHGSGYRGIQLLANGSKIYNNFIFNFSNATNARGISLGMGASTIGYAYNNTVYGVVGGNANARGFYIEAWGASAVAVAENNLSMGCTNSDFSFEAGSGGSITSNNNMSSDATADDGGGSNHLISKTTANQFVSITAGSENLHLKPGADATGFGKSEAATFTDDIDGQERTGNWSIGADEPRETEVNSSQQRVQSITDGLVLYQSFDGSDINGTTAYDRSGQSPANNGIINGATPTRGRKGQALSFDGTDDYETVAASASLESATGVGQARTWTYWLYFKGGANKLITDKDAWSGGHLWSEEQTTYIQGGVVNNDPVQSPALTINTWYHVAFTYDGANTRLYINGTLADGPHAQTAPADNAYEIWVGGGNSCSCSISSTLDELRVYNRALSADEIGDLYTLGQEKIGMSLTNKNTSGLVGMWSFDGADMDWADATGEALDRSGNAKDGNVIGATQTIGKRGQALSFNSNNGDYVEVPDDDLFTLGGSFTISAWIKRNSSILQQAIVEKYNVNDGYILRIRDTNDLRFNVANASGWGTGLSSTVTIDTGRWYHVAAVLDASAQMAYIYLDGAYDNSVAQTIVPTNSDWSLKIGARGNDAAYTFDGILDEVRIYNRALTPDEVGDLYRLGQVKLKR